MNIKFFNLSFSQHISRATDRKYVTDAKSATYEHVVSMVTEILPPMVKFRALMPKIIGTKVKTRQIQN